MAEKDILDFRLKDYEMKVDYLVAQFEGMWTRFQFMLGIETLLVGLFFAPLQSTRPLKVSTFAVIGLLVAILWFVMGAEDKFLVELNRNQVGKAARDVIKFLDIDNEYEFVGQTHVKDVPWYASPVQWRIHQISTTTLVAIFPVIVAILWLVLLLR